MGVRCLLNSFFCDCVFRCAADIGGGAVVYDVLEEAVRDADVVVTVTLAIESIVRGCWLKTGAVVCCKLTVTVWTL